jgi:hypothetical protein
MVFRLLLAFLLAQVLVMAQQPVTAQHPNRIDSLRTDEQVLSFVRGLDIKYYWFYSLKAASFEPPNVKNSIGVKLWRRYQQRVDGFGTRPYEILDLDGNGQSDLLFSGYDTVNCRRLTLLVLSFGKDSFVLHSFPKERLTDFFAARPVRIGNKNFISIIEHAYYYRELSFKNRPIKLIRGYRWQRDTLRCLSGGLVEATRAAGHKVKALKYHLFPGFSTSGSYQLTISQDSLRLEKGCDLSPKTPIDSGGIFIAKMDSATMHRLQELLWYIDFERLKTNYWVGWTDDATGTIDILYDDKKRKVIYDYGLIGTYGLRSLQDLLIDLLTTQTWVRIAPGGPDFLFL